ncbi:MAG: hypothetical protein JWO79_5037 [Actinomycetia bacterium]|nr:hypothetical protein [Actinomycetes bacterium]MDQ1654717.1 hypothetical protein [Cryptosporangiaceae bacterium]MDQ1656493.1 hypothetical protein [Cryptosporangiaceae bacterium]
MTDRNRMPRPVLAADIERLAPSAAEGEPFARLELAHATAAAVVAAGRGDTEPCDRMVRLAETVGLDTLAELWRGVSGDTLPGALWTLYLLRTWCTNHGDEVSRLYRAGRALAPVDEVVAGVHDDADPAAVASLADAVLTGVYDGDLAVALERGAAFFRVVAAGRDYLAGGGPEGAAEARRASRNRSCAESLTRAAKGWRAGTLR